MDMTALGYKQEINEIYGDERITRHGIFLATIYVYHTTQGTHGRANTALLDLERYIYQHRNPKYKPELTTEKIVTDFIHYATKQQGIRSNHIGPLTSNT